ncbi:MAG TPA: hypothetical protein ENH52_04855 [Nitrospirae bacterium]|nr:hypothetical protein [Nitrospirota bacterium]
MKLRNIKWKGIFCLFLLNVILSCGGGSNGGSGSGGRGLSSNGGIDYDDSPFGAHGQNQDYQTISDIGIEWSRLSGTEGLSWELVDNDNTGNYAWSTLDNKINSAKENNINLFITITSLNQKDAETCRSPDHEPDEFGMSYDRKMPCDLKKYKQFIKAAVNRYGVDLIYQVENEIADGHFWKDTPQNYALLLKETYLAVKENCPDCFVAIGSATKPNFWSDPDISVNPEYFEDIFKELKTYPECADNGCHDIFDLHGLIYHPDELSKGLNLTKEAFDNLKALQQAYSFDRPIWSTEAGFLSEDVEWNKKIIAQTYVKGLEMGIEKLFWRVTEECCEIIDKIDSQKTGTYYAYNILIEKIKGYFGITKLSESQYKIEFSDKNPAYLLWCHSGSCEAPSEITGTVLVTDYLGSETTVNAYQMELTESPVFVEAVQ